MVLLASAEAGKASLALGLSDDLVDGQKMDAAAMIREIAREVNGGGGGQKQFATAGGKNPSGIPLAFAKLKSMLGG